MTGPGGGPAAQAGWRSHPIVGRSAWTLVGQAASSGSNFVLAVAMLATATTHEFGVFSVAISAYLLVTQLTRSAFSLPLMVLYSGTQAEKDARRFGPAAGAAVATGLLAAVVFVVAGVAYPAGRTMFLVLAAAIPFLLYQDVLRHVAFAEGTPKRAAEADILWIGAMAALACVAGLLGRGSPVVLFLGWSLAGVLSGGFLGLRLRVPPDVAGAWCWLRTHARLCRQLATEFVVNSGSYYVLSYGLVVVTDAEQLGRWRAAQALIGPVSVLLLGGTALGVPESIRVRDRRSSLRRFAVTLSMAMSAMALAGGAFAYLVLPAVGPTLFAQTWESARPVLPVLTLFAVAVGASVGAIAGLRARDLSGWLVGARAVSGAVAVVLGLGLASEFGAIGALTGLLVPEAGFACVAWLRFNKELVVADATG